MRKVPTLIKNGNFTRYLPCKNSGPFWAGAALGHFFILSRKGELFYLQNKFPNLKSFYLDGEFHEKNENIELIENPNCKINNIFFMIYQM